MVPMLWNLLLFFSNVKFSWFNIVETIGLITSWFFRNAKLGAKLVWDYKYLRMMNLLVFSIKLTNIVPAIRGSCGYFLQISTSHSTKYQLKWEFSAVIKTSVPFQRSNYMKSDLLKRGYWRVFRKQFTFYGEVCSVLHQGWKKRPVNGQCPV